MFNPDLMWKCPRCQQNMAQMWRSYHEALVCPYLSQDGTELVKEEVVVEGAADQIDAEFAAFMDTAQGKFEQFLIDTNRL